MNEEELKKQVSDLVVELINNQNSTFEVKKSGNWIHLSYLGRGSERINLWLEDMFHENYRKFYLNETIERLTKIKKDLLEG